MNFIFDFDGTICDSIDLMLTAVNKFLVEDKKKTILKSELKEMGVEKIIKVNNISLVKMPALIKFARKEVSDKMHLLKVFPGFEKVLKTMATNNRLFIITSNAKENVSLFLENNGISNYFSFIDDSTDLFGKDKKINRVIRKFKLDKNETYYVGDETRDISAAKNANVASVAVTWGYESQKILQGGNPDIIINKPENLLNI